MAVSLNDVVAANPAADPLAGAAPVSTPTDTASLTAPAAAVPAGGKEKEVKFDPDEDVEIPDDVLNIPAMTGLLRGAPPAIYAKEGEKDPQITLAVQNMETLAKVGIEFYRGEKSGLNTLFNTQFISRKAIKKADEQGKLAEVAAPFAEVKGQYDELLAQANPVGAAAPAAVAATGAPAPAPTVGAPNAEVSEQLVTKRTNALAPGGPTSGAAPGQGRVLNQILKQAV